MVPLTLALLGASSVHAATPRVDINKAMRAAPLVNAGQPIQTSVGTVASVDEKRGVPTFLWVAPPDAAQFASRAMTVPPAQIALEFVEKNMALYGLSADAVAATSVRNIHDTGRGGIIVKLGQKIDGIEVLNHTMKVLMDRQGDVIAVAGNLHPDVGSTPAAGGTRSFVVPHDQAVANAFDHHVGIAILRSNLRDLGREENGYRYYDLVRSTGTKQAGIVFANPARAKKIFYALPDRLVPAYYLELDMAHEGSSDADLWSYVVSAEDGELLQRDHLTENAAYNYRLWAETTGDKTPLDGPIADWTPHPTGMPNGQNPPFIASSIVNMDGFNTNPGGTFDPWLPANATATNGNNVNAYADINNVNGYQATDVRPGPSSPGNFDYTYDTALAPDASVTQRNASVTSLFYMNNWLHDYFYDSGFNEAAGNAQVSNFGRGGAQNDPLLAEAQDYSGTDNANMATPADGQSPRMQMYVFLGASDAYVSAQPLNQQWDSGVAAFGPTSFNQMGQGILAADGMGMDVNDLCEAPTNNLSGRVVVVNRGNCTFESKASRAEAAGAVGIIIANNQGGQAPGMAEDAMFNATIPTLSITQDAGTTLKTAMASQTQNLTMFRGTPKVNRDGTLDNQIVAHEWGHYYHHRYIPQTACTSYLNTNFYSGQCPSQSEGWGDFIALHMSIRAPDDVSTGTFADAIYASDAFGDAAYYGIRRFPYTRDFNKNGMTFKHITQGVALPPGYAFAGENHEVHNAGEVWATMLFQAYTELIINGGHPFSEAKRRMADYLTGGLALTPDDPTYTQQRDAILAFARSVDVNDAKLLADGFAARGIGTCAVSPPISSTTHTGVVEDFDNTGILQPLTTTFTETPGCDNDGVVDTGEMGSVNIQVYNPGFGNLLNTQVSISSTTGAVTFPSGTTATIASIAPGAIGSASIPVALAAGTTAITDADFAVTTTNATTCVSPVSAALTGQMNYDDVPTSSATEEFESPKSPWVKWGNTRYQTLALALWNRQRQVLGDYWYNGADHSNISDTAIESPNMTVAMTGNFTIAFTHRHDFDSNATGTIRYDGGVVEITKDNGMTWTDIGTGYGAALAAGSGNPLAGRAAYGRQNAMWPNTNTVTLNLGTAYAGQTVRIRFRIATDNAVHQTNRLGWFIDSVVATGITNTPFWTIAPDPAGCTNLCAGVTCNDNNSCTNDSCNPANGMCVFTNVAAGTTCNDGNACTQMDTCQAGVCTGANPVTCVASDACHVAGTCD
ncbi:MAG TPA: M36 family metallopeptidase, partial [Polyangium sp.]|nr:M36 family metallopeptidase [Polyangium sp.]